MARNNVSDEEIHLRKRARRRLVGSIALVIVAVAAVPLLLDAEPRGAHPVPQVRVTDAPPEPTPPVPVAPPPPADVPDESAPSAPVSLEEAATASPPVPPLAAQRLDGEPDAASAGTPGAQPAGTTTYVVQLIATTSPDKARELSRTLQNQEFPVFTEKTPDGGKIRVRVGPFVQQAAAEAARSRLIQLGFDPGKVVTKGD